MEVHKVFGANYIFCCLVFTLNLLLHEVNINMTAK